MVSNLANYITESINNLTVSNSLSSSNRESSSESNSTVSQNNIFQLSPSDMEKIQNNA